MNRVRIVIEPAAISDIRNARDYYSDKGENTSERFRDELTQVFDLLAGRVSSRCDAFPTSSGTSISKASSSRVVLNFMGKRFPWQLGGYQRDARDAVLMAWDFLPELLLDGVDEAVASHPTSWMHEQRQSLLVEVSEGEIKSYCFGVVEGYHASVRTSLKHDYLHKTPDMPGE